MGVIARLWVEVGADTKKFETGVKNIQGKLTKLQGGLNKFGNVMTLGVTLPILALGKGMLDAAMDLESTEAKFGTVFKGMTKEADAFIKEFKKLTPLTTTQARGVASGIQDLLVPMGFLREDATELTGRFMPLIGALANFNNSTHTAEQVALALSSAIIGEFEPMRRLGVVTSKTAIDQRILATGMAATKDEITDQMRVMALLEIITESSADAISAYTDANLDAKTKLGLLKVEFIDTAAELGKSLIPMIEKAIEYVSKLAEWVGTLTVEQQENLIKWLALAAVIGPASKVAAAFVGLTNMVIGLKTALVLSKVAAAGLAGAGGLGMIAGAVPAASVGLGAMTIAAGLLLAKVGLVVAAIWGLYEAWQALKRLEASGPIMPGYDPGKGLGVQGPKGWGGFSYTPKNTSVTKAAKAVVDRRHTQTSGGAAGTHFAYPKKAEASFDYFRGLFGTGQPARPEPVQKTRWSPSLNFDTGGIVPGPIGSPQLAVVHGGETVLPTHKSNSGSGSMGNTIRHEIDLINIPATVDGASLERTLVEMLNAPQVKRKIDRVVYENQVGAVRGLGA